MAFEQANRDVQLIPRFAPYQFDGHMYRSALKKQCLSDILLT